MSLRSDCPRCGFLQSVAAESCPKCGVVFAKLSSERTRPIPAVEAPAPIGLAETGPTCRACRRRLPLRDVTFRRNIGALIVRFHATASGPMCKGCVDKYFWSYTLATVAVGWLGTISLIVAPIYVVTNIGSYAAARWDFARRPGPAGGSGALQPR